MSDLFKWTKKDLRRLPTVVDFHKTTWYDGLLFFPSKETHDSGWQQMIFVGVNNDIPVEIIHKLCDDIVWPEIPGAYKGLRMDCTPNGIFHIWSSYHKFSLSGYASSTDIMVQEIPRV